MGKKKKSKDKVEECFVMDSNEETFPSLSDNNNSIGYNDDGTKSDNCDLLIATQSSSNFHSSMPASVNLLSPSVWNKQSNIFHSILDKSKLKMSENVKEETEEVTKWCIYGTRNSKLPLHVEKNRNKFVTILNNITGDASCLLSTLKQSLGTGGNVMESDALWKVNDENMMKIEIQGEKVERIALFLCQEHMRLLHNKEKGVLKGISKAEVDRYYSIAMERKDKKVLKKGKKNDKGIGKLDEKAKQMNISKKKK